MKKMWLVARTTYRERLRSGMFLILTFGIPLLMIVAGAIGFIAADGGGGDGTVETVGYVDRTGELNPVDQVTIQEDIGELNATVRFVAQPALQEAKEAYLAGTIDGYLDIPEDYVDGAAVTYYSDEEPGPAAEEDLRQFLQRSQLPGAPDWIFARLANPATYTYVGQATGEAISEGPGLVVRLATPAFLAVAFVLAVFFGTSQLGTAIVREKDQRAMEIVITSLRPLELVAGKIMGMTLLSLTQFAIWAFAGILALALAFSDQIDLQGLVIPWGSLLWGVLLIVPGYFLYAVLAAGLGIIAGDTQQAQQLAGIMSFLGLAPIYILAPILSNPDGPLAVGLTLFPLTSPSVTLLRTIFTQVPAWQMAAALAILLGSLALSVWVTTRIFRAAMLNYGKALRPRDLWQALVQA